MPMQDLAFTATALYAAVSTLLFLFLGLMVSLERRRHGVGVGTGGHESLELAVRAHANATENIPLGLLLLLLFELNGGPALAVHAFGTLFVLSRLGHAFGLARSPGRTAGRFFGMLGTWAVMGLLAAALLVQYAGALFAGEV